MSEWQLIETAPKDGTSIIVFDPTPHLISDGVTRVREPFIACWWEGDSLNRAGWFDGLFCFPTHWMPLPEPPK